LDLQLKGKNALVTGASYGLGFACAEALASEGASVAICSRNATKLNEAVRQIGLTTDSNVIGIAADLTKEPDLQCLIKDVEEQLGSIDILVLSTGHPPTWPFTKATDQQWQEGIDLILRPPILLCRALLDGMRKRKYGRVIFIGSIFGLEPEASSVVQSTLRTGLNAMAKCIATEVAADGVTVNVVCPGYFDTPLVHDLAKQYADTQKTSVESVLEDWKTFSPTKQFGNPQDLGAFISFLASPKGSFITGTTLTMDGGAIKQY